MAVLGLAGWLVCVCWPCQVVDCRLSIAVVVVEVDRGEPAELLLLLLLEKNG